MEKRVTIRNNQSDGENIARGAFSLVLAALGVKVLGLIYKIPLSYILNDEGMGYFNSAYTVYTFFYLICCAGIPKAISILGCEYLAKGREWEVNRIFRVCFGVFLLGSIALSILFMLLATPISALIGNYGARIAMLAVAPTLPFIALGGVMRGYLNAHMKLGAIALSQLVEGAGKLIFGLILAMYSHARGHSLQTVAAFTIFGITLSSIITYAFLWITMKFENRDKHLPKIKSELKRKEILTRIAKIALPVTASAGIVSVTNLCDLTLIMHWLESLGYSETAASALYGNYTTLAVPMFNLAATVVAGVTLAILPSLAKRHAMGDHEEFQKIFTLTLSACGFFAVPIMLGFCVFPTEVLSLFFPEESVAVGASLLAVLSPSIVFMTILTVINTALEASGFVRAPLVTMGVGCAVKLIVSYLLIGNESFGIYGAPIGTVLSYLAGLVVGIVLLKRKKGISLHTVNVLLRPLLLGGVAVSLTALLRNLLRMQANNALQTLISMALCIFIYLAFSLFTGVFGQNGVLQLSKYTKNA